MTAAPPRVGVLGARRTRQGLGPFVARDLARAGARVVALSTTGEASAREAREAFRAQGVEAVAHPSAEALLAREDLDAVAVLSPAGTHGEWLEAALERGLHVLCEKPLLWGAGPGRDAPQGAAPGDGARAARLAEAFAARGLLLRENCQYPELLDAYRALHPGVLERGPTRFAMTLCPEGRGEALLREGLPHALSLVQAVVGPAATVRDATWEGLEPRLPDGDPSGWLGRFTVEAAGDPGPTAVACEVRLTPTDERPRPAAFAFDDHLAGRRVDPDTYRFALLDGARSVPAPDPLGAHVAAFVRELSGVLGGEAAELDARIPSRAVMLEELRAAFERTYP